MFNVILNTKKWDEKEGAANFKVFGNRMKNSFECLIYSHVASQTIDNSWRNSKEKFTKFYDV